MKNGIIKNGYVALVLAIVIGAIALVFGAYLVILGLGSTRSSFALEESSHAKGLANACAEEALQQIRNNSSYTGTNNLNMGQGACTYTVTSQEGNNRTIIALGTKGTVVRKVRLTIDQINPTINVATWQEVASF